MDYSTVKETAQRWGVSVRTVNMYLNAGRVPGAVRKEHGWLVPADAQKPDRKSTRLNSSHRSLSRMPSSA